MCIGLGRLIEFTVVHTKPQSLILCLDKDNQGDQWLPLSLLTHFSNTLVSNDFISLNGIGGSWRYHSFVGGLSPVGIWCSSKWVQSKSSSWLEKTSFHHSNSLQSFSCCSGGKFMGSTCSLALADISWWSWRTFSNRNTSTIVFS